MTNLTRNKDSNVFKWHTNYGINNILLEVDFVASGIYILSLQNQKKIYSEKLIKL